MCAGGKGADKGHCCFRIPNSPRASLFPIWLPRRQRVPPASSRNPAPRNSPNQPGRRRAPGLSGYDSPLAGSQPCRGGRGGSSCLRKPPLGADASLRVGRDAVGVVYPGAGPRRPKSGVGVLSAQRGSCPPGIRAARALRRRILAGGLCSQRPAGGAAPPLGVPLGAAAPLGALSARARSPGTTAPLAGPSCSLSLLLPLARPPARGLQPPGSPEGGGGGRLLRGCKHLQRPGSSLGMHRPPQVAKRGGENAPAPPPPARSPGCGGRGSRRAAAAASAAAGGGGSGAAPGASAPRNNRSGWRWADVRTARRMVHWAFELSSCSRGGARRALTRPWPRAARGGSRGLSLKPPGARRRLASPRARVPRAAPHRRRARLFASPGCRAQPLDGTVSPAVLPAASLRSD